MWLVSYRRQEMLTRGPAADPKSKLNISSFRTCPNLLHCFICAKDVMLIALLMARLGVVDLKIVNF